MIVNLLLQSRMLFDKGILRAHIQVGNDHVRGIAMSQTERPLSPHLGIYRWQITNSLSILHRISGFGLALGLVPLTLWLWGAAYEPGLLKCMTDLFHCILGKIALLGFTLAFYYHLGNGIRHLNWDLGRGFALNEVLDSGRLSVAFSVCLTIFTWAFIAHRGGI